MIPIPTLTPWLGVLLTISFLIFIIFLFLPALWELKNPKDAGPRRFPEVTIQRFGGVRKEGMQSSRLLMNGLWNFLFNMEGGELDAAKVDVAPIMQCLEHLPNIEMLQS